MKGSKNTFNVKYVQNFSTDVILLSLANIVFVKVVAQISFSQIKNVQNAKKLSIKQLEIIQLMNSLKNLRNFIHKQNKAFLNKIIQVMLEIYTNFKDKKKSLSPKKQKKSLYQKVNLIYHIMNNEI